MTDTAMKAAERQADGRAGMYLAFVLAGEEYGLEILKVREIIQMCKITPVPRTPDYVKGVINLRGKVIPILDLRLKFNMPETEHTEQTCIIVVDVDGLETGVIVDQVSEVLDIPADDIDDTPAFGTDLDTEFILGIGKAQGKVSILLDIAKVVGTGDGAAGLRRAVEDAEQEE